MTSDQILIGLFFGALIIFVAWLAWRTEMRPVKRPDGDHWQRPPMEPPEPKP